MSVKTGLAFKSLSFLDLNDATKQKEEQAQ